jgi:hypothetical protein
MRKEFGGVNVFVPNADTFLRKSVATMRLGTTTFFAKRNSVVI